MNGARYSCISSTVGVNVGPGATVFTLTPCGPYSAAHDLVSEWMVALVAL